MDIVPSKLVYFQNTNTRHNIASFETSGFVSLKLRSKYY